MTPDLLHAGAAEGYKGGVHLAMFALASSFAAYNLGAFVSRPTRRLAFNTIVYAALMALEARQTYSHFSSIHQPER